MPAFFGFQFISGSAGANSIRVGVKRSGFSSEDSELRRVATHNCSFKVISLSGVQLYLQRVSSSFPLRNIFDFSRFPQMEKDS